LARSIAGAEAELLAFAERTGTPVASTLLGLSAFPTDHPLYVGMVGMHGRYGANTKTNECDVLVAVGMRFDDRVTGNLASYARQAKVIHLELDAAEIGKNVTPEVALHGDAKDSLAALLERVSPARHEGWLAEFRACDAIEFEQVARQDLHPETGGLRMGEVVRVLSEKTDGQAVVVSDVGQHQMAAARYSRFTRPRSSVTSGGLGTMGFALPAAIGAKLACPERTVVAVIGDGGFQMTMQELGTAKQARAGVKIVILNNSFLGMVRQWQELYFESRYSETEMDNPDFVRIAEAYGIPALRVDAREGLGAAIDTMLEHPGVFLLEVAVEREGNVFPMVASNGSVSDVRMGV
jgi:acetolactate synthase-1/2/3 large subunit